MEQRVNTGELTSGAKAVLDLSSSVNKTRDHLYGVNVHAGGFDEGVKLQSKVKEAVESYELLLGKVRDSLMELSEALEEVAKGAEQTEETNTTMAKENPFSEVWEETGGAPPPMTMNPTTTTNPTTTPADSADKTGS